MKILIISADPVKVNQIEFEYRNQKNIAFDHVVSAKDFVAASSKEKYSLIICDYYFNDVSVIDLLSAFRFVNKYTPFIVVSDSIGDEKVAELFKRGATDFILSSNIHKLPEQFIQEDLFPNTSIVAHKDSYTDFDEGRISHSLIEHMNEGILLTDENGKILFINNQFCQITGYAFEEAIRMNGYDFLANKNEIVSLKQKIENRKRGDSEIYDLSYIRKDRSVLYVRNSASPVVDNGKFVGVLSVLTDITNEKKHEKVLELISESLDLVTGRDYFSNLTEFLFKNFGSKKIVLAVYSNDSSLAKTISVRIDGEIQENYTYSILNSPCWNLLNQRICSYPANVLTHFPDGHGLQEIDAQSYLGISLYDNLGVAIGLLSIIDDKPIVEIRDLELVLSLIAGRAGAELQRSLLENSLIESETKYRKVVEDQSEYIFRWQPGGQIIFANKSFLEFHNASVEEMLQRNVFDFISSSDQIRFKNKIAQLTPQNPVITDVHYSVHPVIGPYWHEWSDRALFNSEGSVIEYQSIGRDISKKRIALIRLEESEKLKESILSALPSNIAVINLKGEIISVNQNWSNFTISNSGIKELAGVGRNYLDICQQAYDEGDQSGIEVYNGIKSVLEGNAEKFEHIYPCHSPNEERWFQMIVTPFTGLSSGVVISHFDITEKRKQDQRILLSLTELKQIDLINRSVINGLSLQEILKLLLDSFVEIHGQLAGRIYFIDSKSKKLVLEAEHASSGLVNQIEKRTGINIQNLVPDISEGSYFGNVLKSKKYIFATDKKSILDFVQNHSSNKIVQKFAGWAIEFIKIKSIGMLPLSVDGNVFGLITISAQNKISEDAEKTFIRLVEQTSIAIAKRTTEEKLLERENYLSALIESIPDMLFRLNPEGKILDYKSNDGGVSKSGNDGNLKGHNFLKLLPKKAIAVHKKSVEEAMMLDKIISYEFEIEMPGGNSQFYETRVKSNSLNQLVLIVRDITAKKRQDILLQEKEKNLQDAQAIANVGSWRYEIGEGELEWSDETYRIFEVERGTKLTFETFINSVHPEDREYVNARWHSALKKNDYNFDHRLFVNGKSKWVKEIAKIEFDGNGTALRGVGTIQDITDKKVVEQELMQREELLSFSHKISKTGYFTLKINQRILFWSKELYEIFELSDSETKPSLELFFNMIHEEDKVRAKEYLIPILTDPKSFSIDYRITTRSGNEKFIRETGEIKISEHGEKIIIGVLQDITEIKDFENALLQRERQIKRSNKLNTQIIETSDQFFYASKVGGNELTSNKLTYVSPQVEEIFGFTPVVFLSDISIWHNSIHPDDFEHAMSASKQMYFSKTPLTLEYRVKNNVSGNYMWIEDYACPSLNADGEVLEIYGSVKNIDERKKSEEELLKRERLLREAQRIAKLGSWEWNMLENTVELNDEMYRILEIDPEAFGGKLEQLFEFVSEQSVPRFAEAISKAQTDYKSEDVELRIKTAKGTDKILLLRGGEHREVVGNSFLVRGTVLDISELWNTHEALFETEEKFRKIFENVSDIYYQTDVNGIITMVSPSCQNSIGYTPDELLGRHVIELYSNPAERENLISIIQKDGFANNYELSLIGKNGNVVFVSANITLVYDHDRKPVGLQGMLRDITEKRKSDIERDRLLLELTNKYNQLMQFNYIVSHNLRSPITNLLGLSTMFEGELSDVERVKVIQHIRNSVLAMDGLVKDLNIILSSQAAINASRENVKLTDVFETVKSNLNREIESSGAMLISDIAEDNDTIYTIKSYIQSIFYNLANNAIKYRSPERHPVIHIACQQTETYYIVSVSDNGNGIDLAKYGSQLFGLYKRFDLSKEGRGLGLHMTKTQVEALGGEIKVESEIGKGTTFIISLPK